MQGYCSDNSLGALTKQYMRLLKTSGPEMLDLNKAAAALKVGIHADDAWHLLVTAAPASWADSCKPLEIWHGLHARSAFSFLVWQGGMLVCIGQAD